MTEIQWIAKNVGTIGGLLTSEACDEFVRFGEERRYEEAPISTDRGAVMMKHLLNNDRVMLDDITRSNQFYELPIRIIPPRFEETWRPVGLDERLRFYRYDVGQLFDWHSDGYFERANGERSFFTFMIYSNDDFDGGGTSFRFDEFRGSEVGQFTVRPKKGMGLLLHHPIAHRGDAVAEGRKYVVRTDVMYGKALRSVG